MIREQTFMLEAIRAAAHGMQGNEGGPFGCVIVKNDEIIARGCNKVTSSNDPTAHAEIVAIRNACEKLGTFQLDGCEIYASCEPCPMCMGAVYWARPAKIYYAASKEDAATAGFDDSFIYSEIALPVHERKIEMQHIYMGEALQLFKQWEEMNDKKRY